MRRLTPMQLWRNRCGRRNEAAATRAPHDERPQDKMTNKNSNQNSCCVPKKKTQKKLPDAWPVGWYTVKTRLEARMHSLMVVEGMATQRREQRELKRTEATHTGGQVLKGERRDKKELETERERDPRASANQTHKTYNTSPAQTHTHTHTHTPTTNVDCWPGQPTSWRTGKTGTQLVGRWADGMH